MKQESRKEASGAVCYVKLARNVIRKYIARGF
jgi:hypothetical protein